MMNKTLTRLTAAVVLSGLALAAAAVGDLEKEEL
jgi:hypothetical protein